MTAATSGYMPDGLQTNQSLFPREYMTYFNSKYVEWAPEPWSKLPNPQTDMGPVLGILRPPGDSPPPIFRIMHTIGEMDRALSMIMSRQKNEIEPSLKAMKSRVSYAYLDPGASITDYSSQILDLAWPCACTGCPLASQGSG